MSVNICYQILQLNQIDIRSMYIFYYYYYKQILYDKKMSPLTTAPETRIYISVGASFCRITSSLGGKYSASTSETFFKRLIALVSFEISGNYLWANINIIEGPISLGHYFLAYLQPLDTFWLMNRKAEKRNEVKEEGKMNEYMEVQ